MAHTKNFAFVTNDITLVRDSDHCAHSVISFKCCEKDSFHNYWKPVLSYFIRSFLYLEHFLLNIFAFFGQDSRNYFYSLCGPMPPPSPPPTTADVAPQWGGALSSSHLCWLTEHQLDLLPRPWPVTWWWNNLLSRRGSLFLYKDTALLTTLISLPLSPSFLFISLLTLSP